MVACELIDGPYDGHRDVLLANVVPALVLAVTCRQCERVHTMPAGDNALTVGRLHRARREGITHGLYLLDGQHDGYWRYRWEGTHEHPAVRDGYEARQAVPA